MQRSVDVLSMNAQWRLSLLVALALLAGCATHVRVVPRTASSPAKHISPPVARQVWWQKDSLESTVVRRHKLATMIRTDAELALLTLHEAVARDAKRDELLATAGLTVRYAGEIERTHPAKATSWYLMAAALAYRNLAAEFESSATNAPTSPMVQSYNQATLGVVMLWSSG